MKKAIVVTSINPPTTAVKKFAEHSLSNDDLNFYVVGDTKTDQNWHCDGVDFLGITEQENIFYDFSKILPFKNYARKNLGYLKAINDGAKVIFDTDDDNLPYEFWSYDKNASLNKVSVTGDNHCNIYKFYTSDIIWPRGLPLDKINCESKITGVSNEITPIRQNLADLDPDVDAIYRLIFKKSTKFSILENNLVPEEKVFVPFNSQNTYFDFEVFPLLYLPSYVPFRMSDIWRSFVAQRICWQFSYRICFSNADLYQERNEHNLMNDFNQEVEGYLKNSFICKKLEDLDLNNLSISECLIKCYELLIEQSIVDSNEMQLIEFWTDFFKKKEFKN